MLSLLRSSKEMVWRRRLTGCRLREIAYVDDDVANLVVDGRIFHSFFCAVVVSEVVEFSFSEGDEFESSRGLMAFLCGRRKRGWKRSSSLRVTDVLLGKFVNQDRTSESSAKVIVQFGWSVPRGAVSSLVQVYKSKTLLFWSIAFCLGVGYLSVGLVWVSGAGWDCRRSQ